MNILYIIGNGFDLNIGMKTRYKDFYDFYIEKDSSIDLVKRLKESIFQNHDNWSDLELAFGNYTKEFNSVNDLRDVYIDLAKKLCEYLDIVEKELNFDELDRKNFVNDLIFPEKNLRVIDEDLVKSIKNKYSLNSWHINIITLNYTKVIDRIIADIAVNEIFGRHDDNRKIFLKSTEHIHGYIDERMVLGVNDISQIKNTSFHDSQDVLEMLVKNTCNIANRHGVEKKFENLISSANIICIFGSSIGNTDKIWWELIGKQLLEGCLLVIYDRSNFDLGLAGLYPSETRRIRDKFLKMANLTGSDRIKAEKNILVGLNTEMFKLI